MLVAESYQRVLSVWPRRDKSLFQMMLGIAVNRKGVPEGNEEKSLLFPANKDIRGHRCRSQIPPHLVGILHFMFHFHSTKACTRICTLGFYFCRLNYSAAKAEVKDCLLLHYVRLYIRSTPPFFGCISFSFCVPPVPKTRIEMFA